MFKKIFTLLFVALIAALLSSEISQAQTTYKKDVYPLFAITPMAGIQFPIGTLNDNYKLSFNAGLEAAMRINRETAFFLKAGYYNMPRKSDMGPGPDANYIEITAGPRYVLTSPKVKAQLFVEAGIGAYMFMTREWTDPYGTVISSTTKTNFGVNGGPGVIIPMGSVADFMLKAKMHYTFEDGGAHTFLSTEMGINFKL
ncbi:MAG: outer membrane beta-barrel protein [Ignavibacteria bacterium]|nr:outer membrane beta-barrel protein [Ignavibacteria bacterium]